MDDKIIIVLGASLFVLCLLLFLFSFVYRYQKRTIAFINEKKLMQSRFDQVLRQSQIEVQETTYKRIANELHDNIGQLLSTTKMLVGLTEIKLGQMPDTLNTANATLTKAIQEIRLLSRSLDKEWLEQFSFIDNLNSEINRINTGGIIKARVDLQTDLDMNPEEQIILFRIVQEAVQNAIKHAQPANLAIKIAAGQEVIVTIVNDGKMPHTDFKGMGTNNMRQRAQLLGGRIEWSSSATETTVTVYLPLRPFHGN